MKLEDDLPHVKDAAKVKWVTHSIAYHGYNLTFAYKLFEMKNVFSF